MHKFDSCNSLYLRNFFFYKQGFPDSVDGSRLSHFKNLGILTWELLSVSKFFYHSNLREINFWDSRSAISGISTHLEAQNFDFY